MVDLFVHFQADENRKINGVSGHNNLKSSDVNGDIRSSCNGSGSPDVEAIAYPLNPPPPAPPVYGKSHIYKDPHVFSQVDQVAINVSNSATGNLHQLRSFE